MKKIKTPDKLINKAKTIELEKFKQFEKIIFYFESIKTEGDNNLRNIINRLICKTLLLYYNNINIGQNLIKFANDLSINYEDRKNIDKNYFLTNIEYIENYFNEKSILEFKRRINEEKEKFISFRKGIIADENEFLRNYIKNNIIFNNKHIPEFDKKKNYIKECIDYSPIYKRYLDIEEIKNPGQFINKDDILNDINNFSLDLNTKNNSIFILCLLGKMLEKNGAKIYISKEKDQNFDNIELATMESLLLLGKKKKYIFHFDFDKKKNEKILNDLLIQKKFIEDLKNIIKNHTKTLDINKFIFGNVHKGCVAVDVAIIDSSMEEVNEILSLEGRNSIKKITVQPLLDSLKLSPDLLDPIGDRKKGWGENEKRGGEQYIPPLDGWQGIGLKVKDKYGNNDWLDYRNRPGEFSIAYLNICDFQDDIISNIVNISNIESESFYSQEIDCRNTSFFSNKRCGYGVYLFQDPKDAEDRTGFLDLFGYRIKIILMCRINPAKIRQPKNTMIWILNPNSEEIRPYRLLIKILPNSPLTISNYFFFNTKRLHSVCYE